MSDTVPVRELWYVNNKKLLNRAISFMTWLPNLNTEKVSHCEVWEPNSKGIFSDYNNPNPNLLQVVPFPYHHGQCWTSTTRGKANGTVVRPAYQVLTHPERWYYTEHEVKWKDFSWAQAGAQMRVDNNKGYAWSELLRYVMPFWLFKRTLFYDPSREKCSPHVEQWQFDMGVLPDIRLRSPRRLCKHVVLATKSPLRRLVDDVIVRDGKWKKVKKL